MFLATLRQSSIVELIIRILLSGPQWGGDALPRRVKSCGATFYKVINIREIYPLIKRTSTESEK